MSPEAEQETNKGGTGLAVLVLMLRFHGVAVDPQQLVHQFGGAPIDTTAMLRAAKELKMKARAVTSDWSRLALTPFPALPMLPLLALASGRSAESFRR